MTRLPRAMPRPRRTAGSRRGALVAYIALLGTGLAGIGAALVRRFYRRTNPRPKLIP